MSKSITFAALPVNMKNFKLLLTSISPEYSVCVRGRHAVGKSEGVYQAAQEMRSEIYKDPEMCKMAIKEFGGKIKTPNGWVTEWSYDLGIPVLERRLSQMTEGDIVGLPFMKGEDTFDKNGHKVTQASTSFKPCDWLITSCEVPVVLFLDERNRALEGVKQAVFQLTDSKAFYGYYLHADSRVVVAENSGDEYQVQQCDPAEISRCATVILEPSVKDWIDYATPRCHEGTIEFIRQNENLLENKGPFEPDTKYPDRRAWFKLDQEAQRLDLFDSPDNILLDVLACSMLGISAGRKFTSFLKERDREVSAKDILKNWASAKKRLAGKSTVTNEQYVECASKLEVWTTKNTMDDKQAEQYGRFMQDAPAEVMMVAWSNLMRNNKNVARVHSYTEKLIMATMNGDDVSNIKIPSAAEKTKGKKTATAPAAVASPGPEGASADEGVGEPKKRGAKR